MDESRVRVKICCISSIEEARLALKYGASALGLVSEMPSGPGVIPDDLIAQITAEIPPGISSFLLTSKQSSREIIEQQRKTGVNTVQIVDRLEKSSYDDFKREIPGTAIVQVVHIKGEESFAEAMEMSLKVDFLLLDSGNQSLSIKELGGTGRTHNWDISSRIVRESVIPVYLAGGLNPDNINAAINKVKPFGIDICSGVRTGGKLDELKLKRLFVKMDRYKL